MSWFWRTPSTLARSLMRDVAPAATGTHMARTTANTAALNVFVITAPQCDVRLVFVMRGPCQPRAPRKRLTMLRFPNRCGPGRQARIAGAADFAGAFTRG